MQKKETPSLSLVVPSPRSEEHTSELQSHLISYAVFCLKKKKNTKRSITYTVCTYVTHITCVCGHTPVTVRLHSLSLHHDTATLYVLLLFFFFFFNDTATPEIYTLSLHDALPI